MTRGRGESKNNKKRELKRRSETKLAGTRGPPGAVHVPPRPHDGALVLGEEGPEADAVAGVGHALRGRDEVQEGGREVHHRAGQGHGALAQHHGLGGRILSQVLSLPHLQRVPKIRESTIEFLGS